MDGSKSLARRGGCGCGAEGWGGGCGASAARQVESSSWRRGGEAASDGSLSARSERLRRRSHACRRWRRESAARCARRGGCGARGEAAGPAGAARGRSAGRSAGRRGSDAIASRRSGGAEASAGHEAASSSSRAQLTSAGVREARARGSLRGCHR
ncbi:hypothetical protein AB1Y20_017125 [Prymnesium parvum]|uniref:Uncharacterized protein n=1 Tax=Prymnesium parvum TaxID=97485 RepID=A0AB34I847_PRYPA